MSILLSASLRELTHIIAHKAACEHRVVHGDISDGNILIVGADELGDYNSGRVEGPKPEIEGGMLIDWDFSNIVDPNKPSSARTVSQLYEAVYPTLTYFSPREPGSLWRVTSLHHLLSRRHLIMTSNRFSGFSFGWSSQMDTIWKFGSSSAFLEDNFFQKRFESTRGIIGGCAKMSYLTARLLKEYRLKISENETLTEFLDTLKNAVASRYLDPPGPPKERALTHHETEVITDRHSMMLGLFAKVLSEKWPQNDKVIPQKFQLSISDCIARRGTKRKRSMSSSSKRHRN